MAFEYEILYNQLWLEDLLYSQAPLAGIVRCKHV